MRATVNFGRNPRKSLKCLGMAGTKTGTRLKELRGGSLFVAGRRRVFSELAGKDYDDVRTLFAFAKVLLFLVAYRFAAPRCCDPREIKKA